MTQPQQPFVEQTDSDPTATDRRYGVAAGRVLATGAFGLLLAIALNSQQLLREAQQKPFGWERDVSVAVWEPIEAVSSAIGLHLARQWTDQALNRSTSDPGGGPAVATEAAPVTEPSSGVVIAEQPGDGAAEGVVGDVTPDPASTPTIGGQTAGVDGQRADAVSTASADAVSSEVPVTTIPWFPTPEEPLRLQIIGDSMVRFFGDTMVSLATGTGVIDAATEHQLSSGLTRPDFYDWPERLIEVMADDDPDAVVLMYGGNDAQALAVDGQIARPFSDAWVGEYSARVGHAMDLVITDPDRLLIWVGQPIMRDPDFDQKMQRLNEVYAAEAGQRARVHYVDTRDLFRGPDGGFSRFVIDQDGQRTDVRLTDGVHLSTIGGRWLSALLLEEIGNFVDLDSGAPQ